jgi:hypothetical protein
MAQSVRFKSDGGAIVAEITCGHSQEGSYGLLLWEANTNTIVMEKRGNFFNTDDDAYELPKPNEKNHGRLVECIVTVVLTPPIKKYAVFLKFRQGGKTLGTVSSSGESDQPMVTLDLFASLEAQGGGGA